MHRESVRTTASLNKCVLNNLKTHSVEERLFFFVHQARTALYGDVFSENFD